LNIEQIEEICQIIMSERKYLRIEEIAFVLQRAKRQKNFQFKIDGSDVFGLLDDYERQLENERHSEHIYNKGNNYDGSVTKRLTEEYKTKMNHAVIQMELDKIKQQRNEQKD
jgi:hypothetical protein